ncbi:MAG: CinA family protein [Pirellulaceae bacterium]|nr:CinA family protein [Pirellulaceae bacterium]
MVAENLEKEEELLAHLKRLGWTLVLAESCTCGLAAARLGLLPGISSHFAGSLVTYQKESKESWLQMGASIINRHTPESLEVTAEMAHAALARTAHAHVGAAITGHFGPNAPTEKDGQIFIVVALGSRQEGSTLSKEFLKQNPVLKATLRLATTSRIDRQREAVDLFFGQICQAIQKVTC